MFLLLSISMNRAQYIIEAVLSGMEYLGGRPALTNIVQVFYRHLQEWGMNQPRKIGLLAKALHEDPTLREARINIQPLQHPNTHMLFTAAAYNASNGKITVRMNPSFVFENEKRLLQHIGILQSMLQHEYTHKEQFNRMPAHASSKRSDIHMARSYVSSEQSFADYRHEFEQSPTWKDKNLRVARNVSVGIPRAEQTAQQWYHSTPEEIMAWAVSIGSLMAQLRRKELPFDSRHLIALQLQAEVYTVVNTLGQNSQSPAMNRFKRHLLDYLVQHEGYAPQMAAQNITQLLQQGRG